jgi:hypothetical protein
LSWAIGDLALVSIRDILGGRGGEPRACSDRRSPLIANPHSDNRCWDGNA